MKSRIVNQNYEAWLPLANLREHPPPHAPNERQMPHDFGEAHERHAPRVLEQFETRRGHAVTADAEQLRFGKPLPQFGHHARAMRIARGFPGGYEDGFLSFPSVHRGVIH